MSQTSMVLVVDDDDIFLNITEMMLRKLGLDVMTAHDGIEAISVFQEHAENIDCVVLDLQMPRMNGINVFRHLRNMRENIHVIIASGYLDRANLQQLDPLQPAGYLKKPVSYLALSDLLTKCLPDEK